VRSAQVTLLGEEFREQVAGPRRHQVPLGGDSREHFLGLCLAAECEQRPYQVDTGIGEGLAAILDRGREFLGGALGVIRHHPLLAGPQVRLGALARFGFLGQIGHADRGTNVIAGPCRLELDLVEVFDARHSPYRTVVILSQTWRNDRSGNVFRLRSHRRARSIASQNPRRSACRTSSCNRKSMGSVEPCNSLASRSEGIRGLRASTASSHSVGASRATEPPKSWPSTCADCTASASEIDGWGGAGWNPDTLCSPAPGVEAVSAPALGGISGC
jgi:hypothetical protein